MKNLTAVIPLISSILMFSCDQHETRTVTHPNGQEKETYSVYQDKDGSFIKDGPYAKWYLSGQPEFEGSYRDGKQHGDWKNWYENGQIWVTETYKDGELVGKRQTWWDNGNAGRLEEYGQDHLKIGTWKTYRKDGSQLSECTYQEGKLIGMYTIWNAEGNVIVEREFDENGQDVKLPATYGKRNSTIVFNKDNTYSWDSESLFGGQTQDKGEFTLDGGSIVFTSNGKENSRPVFKWTDDEITLYNNQWNSDFTLPRKK